MSWGSTRNPYLKSEAIGRGGSSNNPEVLETVKQGMASLVGVTKEEEQAIIQSFNEISISSYYWN
nr:competence pheromone ComX [Bacillus sp. REN10]